MIPLHRMTHPDETFWLNPSLIQTVESTPDTVISLTNSSKFVVMESAADVTRLVRDWKAGILSTAMTQSRKGAVGDAAGDLLRFPGRT
jgi:flagellar protein FlbD